MSCRKSRRHTKIRYSCPFLTSRIFDLIVLFVAFNSLYFASEGLEMIFEDILINVWKSGHRLAVMGQKTEKRDDRGVMDYDGDE